MSHYSDVDWKQDVSEESMEMCRPFQGLPMYQDLVSMLDHIMTYSRRQFEIRQKISIPSLAKVLRRSRELLANLDPWTECNEADVARYCDFYDHSRRYKCSKVTCGRFSKGFSTNKELKRHENTHERPYQCEIPDCLGQEGFANSRDLEK